MDEDPVLERLRESLSGRAGVASKSEEADLAQARHSLAEGDFTRASGDFLCGDCGRPYWKHPSSEHRDWDGYPFLRRLCNGKLVKL